LSGFFICSKLLNPFTGKAVYAAHRMSIFSKFKGDKLSPSWRFSAATGSIIWKLLISPDGILVGEERDPENKTGTLFAIDVRQGTTLFRDKKIDEPWWFNSEQATRENIYIHKFRKPDMPEPRGVTALNVKTGELRWEQPDVSMLFELDGKLYSQRDGYGGKEFFALDSLTGEVAEAFGSEHSEILSRRALVRDDDAGSQFSIPVLPEDEIFSEIAKLLGESLNITELRGSIDFAEYGKYIIFSYHERITNDANAALGNMLRNDIRILDTDKGDIVHSQTLNSQTPYPVPENFFINHGVLIYVKEKNEVVGISLA
jgi:hypothetical protein